LDPARNCKSSKIKRILHGVKVRRELGLVGPWPAGKEIQLRVNQTALGVGESDDLNYCSSLNL
jgi:hypothetical protein